MKKSDLEFPPVPTTAFSHLGPVSVGFDKLDCHGVTNFANRTITLHEGQHPAVQWGTYWHEVCHLVLWDGGVKVGGKLEEQICDVIGTYLAAAVKSGALKVNL